MSIVTIPFFYNLEGLLERKFITAPRHSGDFHLSFKTLKKYGFHIENLSPLLIKCNDCA